MPARGRIPPAPRATRGSEPLRSTAAGPLHQSEQRPCHIAKTGIALSARQQYQAAADCYRKALAINPKIPELQLNLALAEFKLGRFRAAIGPLKVVLAAKPGNMQARTLLGMSYYGLSQFAEALPFLEAALAADADNQQLRYVVAQSALQSATYDLALKHFEWLAQRQPDPLRPTSSWPRPSMVSAVPTRPSARCRPQSSATEAA